MTKPTTLLLLLALGGPALAQSTPRSEARVIKVDGTDPIDLRLETPHVLPALTDLFEPTSLNMRLRELPPETLVLRFALSQAVDFYLTADLDDRGVARLDDIDGETYFAAGLELHVTPVVSLFVEDYQSASMVMGSERLEDEPVPDRTWDGHQFTAGVRLSLSERLSLEGAAVGYALSITDRGEGAGGRAQLTLRF